MNVAVNTWHTAKMNCNSNTKLTINQLLTRIVIHENIVGNGRCVVEDCRIDSFNVCLARLVQYHYRKIVLIRCEYIVVLDSHAATSVVKFNNI